MFVNSPPRWDIYFPWKCLPTAHITLLFCQNSQEHRHPAWLDSLSQVYLAHLLYFISSITHSEMKNTKPHIHQHHWIYQIAVLERLTYKLCIQFMTNIRRTEFINFCCKFPVGPWQPRFSSLQFKIVILLHSIACLMTRPFFSSNSLSKVSWLLLVVTDPRLASRYVGSAFRLCPNFVNCFFADLLCSHLTRLSFHGQCSTSEPQFINLCIVSPPLAYTERISRSTQHCL